MLCWLAISVKTNVDDGATSKYITLTKPATLCPIKGMLNYNLVFYLTYKYIIINVYILFVLRFGIKIKTSLHILEILSFFKLTFLIF